MSPTRGVAAAAVTAVVLSGCGSQSKAAVEKHLLRGVEQIRETNDMKQLREKLVRTLASLKGDDAPTEPLRTAKALAIRGFASTLKGLESQLDFHQNDSGNIVAATRDAIRGDRGRRRGARLLRAAGRAVGLRIGQLSGY